MFGALNAFAEGDYVYRRPAGRGPQRCSLFRYSDFVRRVGTTRGVGFARAAAGG